RYAKLAEARGARVVFEVQQPLVRLLAQSFPTMRIIDPEQEPADFDLNCPLLSLPLAFATTVETIPSERRYLQADATLRRRWAARLPTKTAPRVGVAWSGSTLFRNDYSRTMDLATYRSLLAPGVEWICIQKELRPSDVAVLRTAGDI